MFELVRIIEVLAIAGPVGPRTSEQFDIRRMPSKAMPADEIVNGYSRLDPDQFGE
jgi:hypothetical protein